MGVRVAHYILLGSIKESIHRIIHRWKEGIVVGYRLQVTGRLSTFKISDHQIR